MPDPIQVKMIVWEHISDTMFSLGPDAESIEKMRAADIDPSHTRYLYPFETESGEWEIML